MLETRSHCAQALYFFLEMLHVQLKLRPRTSVPQQATPRSSYLKSVALRAVIRIPCSRPCIFMATFGATTRLTVILCSSKVCSVRDGKKSDLTAQMSGSRCSQQSATRGGIVTEELADREPRNGKRPRLSEISSYKCSHRRRWSNWWWSIDAGKVTPKFRTSVRRHEFWVGNP